MSIQSTEDYLSAITSIPVPPKDPSEPDSWSLSGETAYFGTLVDFDAADVTFCIDAPDYMDLDHAKQVVKDLQRAIAYAEAEAKRGAL